MHTFKYGNVSFLHCPDCGGEVEIVIHKKDGRAAKTFKVPGDAVLAFVAYVVRNHRAQQIEEMSDEEVLGL